MTERADREQVEEEVARVAGAIVRMFERDRVEQELRGYARTLVDNHGVELFVVDITGAEDWITATAEVSDSDDCPVLRFSARTRAAICTCGTLWVAEPRYLAAEDMWRLRPVSYPPRRPLRR